jgi:hypothetical protein
VYDLAMPPGAEWTLHYALGDIGAARADFERLQGHPEVHDANLTEGLVNPITTIRIRFADDIQMPQDPSLLALYWRITPARPRPDYGWVVTPADPTARLPFTISPHLLQHDVSHRDVANGIEPTLDPTSQRRSRAFAISGFAREWAGVAIPRLQGERPQPTSVVTEDNLRALQGLVEESNTTFRREYEADFDEPVLGTIPAGVQPIIDFDPNPELLAQHRLSATIRQEITVLGPDIGNPEQVWRRRADGVIGRTVSRPVDGRVRLTVDPETGEVWNVPFDIFIRDWEPVEDPDMPVFTLDGAMVRSYGVEVRPGQFCQRIRDGLTGHVRSVPAVAFDSFVIASENSEVAVSVKVAEFFRDWALVREPEPPSFWDRLLKEDE